MKHEFVNYTDRALQDMVTSRFILANPLLKAGETLKGPTQLVLKGKRIGTEAPPEPDNLVRIDLPQPLTLPSQELARTVNTTSVRLNFRDIQDLSSQKFVLDLHEPMYIHPYVTIVPQREWLENFDVGDDISISLMSPEIFAPVYVPLVVTQELIDHNSYLIYRFALSSV